MEPKRIWKLLRCPLKKIYRTFAPAPKPDIELDRQYLRSDEMPLAPEQWISREELARRICEAHLLSGADIADQIIEIVITTESLYARFPQGFRDDATDSKRHAEYSSAFADQIEKSINEIMPRERMRGPVAIHTRFAGMEDYVSELLIFCRLNRLDAPSPHMEETVTGRGNKREVTFTCTYRISTFKGDRIRIQARHWFKEQAQQQAASMAHGRLYAEALSIRRTIQKRLETP